MQPLDVIKALDLTDSVDAKEPPRMDETEPTPISDEDLQRLSVGEVIPHNAPITLADYDPGWPRLFAREADRIRAVLRPPRCRSRAYRRELISHHVATP